MSDEIVHRRPALLGAVIVSLSLIVAAALIALSAANLSGRPIAGSFSGSVVAMDGAGGDDLMGTYQLKDFLGLYPASEEAYDEEDARIVQSLEADIASGRYPDFPFVRIEGRMFYSRKAVEEWFYAKGMERLTVE